MDKIKSKDMTKSITIMDRNRLAGIRKMLREQFGIGVYEAETNQIQDEIIKEVMSELKQKKMAMSK